MNNLEAYIPYVSPIWPHLLKTTIVRGEGTYVWDQTGRRYLDFTSGIGVTNTNNLTAVGVENIRGLAAREPEELHAEIMAKITPAAPSLAKVKIWVYAARRRTAGP